VDGARFAIGLAALGCSPAEMTWKRGVDILSFGTTKNGCWCAEVVVFFDPEKAHDFPFLRKRAAQLFSKSRFVSAQLEAYLCDDLWLKTAQHANKMADDLAAILKASEHMRLARQPQTNEVLAVVEKSAIAKLKTNGIVFYQG
jgi:threonine aldolase